MALRHPAEAPVPRDPRLGRHCREARGIAPVTAIIGATRWKTSIFWDRKRDAYLLPVKAAVRTKEQLREGDSPEIALVAGFTIG